MKKHLKHDKSKTEKSTNDICQDTALFSLDDKHFDGFGTRLELFGDSDLIVNWVNAVWPVYNYKQQCIIGHAQTCLWRWSQQYGLRPRNKYSDWLRHVPRELNQACDDLAAKGKELMCNDLHIDFVSYDLRGK